MQDVRHSSANANANQSILPMQLTAQDFPSHSLNPQFPTGGFVQIRAYAKINLFLDVLGKRDDNYHNLISIMQSLELCDDLQFELCNTTNINLELNEHSNGNNLPLDDSNLIIKAAKLLTKEYKINQGVNIKLTKRIPMGAGLGGGSSDCAATLHGLNKLFNLNIPLHRLVEIGTKLGADVPFCLMGGTALAQGIGEKLTPLPPHPPCHVVLACPNIHVSTGHIFGKLNLLKTKDCYSDAITAYKTGDILKIANHLFNIFTPITSAIYPQISHLIADFKAIGALGANMTGTGSTVFAYFENEKNAQNACDIISNKHSVKTILSATRKGEIL